MTKPCEHHSEVAHRIARLEMRMDRIELGIVAMLVGMIVQLWMLWDLPGQIEHAGRIADAVKPVIAEER